jgi:predicted phosphoadenosine phosphosulfate sulfurtransferase
VPVLFLDQEAEWDATIQYVRSLMNDPRVAPYWFQAPFLLFNATSSTDGREWLQCWHPGQTWLRDREPNSIHENITGTNRFYELFGAVQATYWPGQRVAMIGGMRIEESPKRMLGLTAKACYKDITYGSRNNQAEAHFTFHPLYDWRVTDVWKAIHQHGWPYNRLYDYMFQYGIPLSKMRVSNVHHENATDALKFLQEVEPETWDKIVTRLASVNAFSKVAEAYQCPAELPPMFTSWREYRDFLVERLAEPHHRPVFHRLFKSTENAYYKPHVTFAQLVRVEITTVLLNDFEGTKLGTFRTRLGLLKKEALRLGHRRLSEIMADDARPDPHASGRTNVVERPVTVGNASG